MNDQQVLELAEEAWRLPSKERSSFLATVADLHLRGEVEALLVEGEAFGHLLNEDWCEEDPFIGQMIGPYRILSVLGRGGMGSVYLAEQTTPVNRQVAIKFMSPALYGAFQTRFRLERQILARMNHSFIARLYGTGMTDSHHPYLIMEYVPGLPITRFCGDRGLGLRARLALFVKVCRAIQHAHELGVIHRDVKPSNILVVEESGAMVPKVIDFGVAKVVGESFTRTLPAPLTFRYMSPEQAGMVVDGNNSCDHRTDIYSLGVVLYELLTDRLPLDMDEEKDLVCFFRVWQERDPPAPSKLWKAKHRGADQPIRRDLDWVVKRAMAHQPCQRYAQVADLAEDLERYLAGRAVAAHPPSRIYTLRRLLVRQRLPLMGLGLLLLLLATGLTWSWTVKRQERFQTSLEAATRELTRGEYERALPALGAAYVEGYSSSLGFLTGKTLRNHYHRAIRRPEEILIAGAFDHATRQAALVSSKGSVALWDGTPDMREFGFETDPISSVVFDPSGWLLVATLQGRIAAIDPKTSALKWRNDAHPGLVPNLVAHPTGDRLLTYGVDGWLKFWSTTTGQLQAQWNMGVPIRKGLAAPGGDWFLAGGSSGRVALWQPLAGRHHVLNAHTKTVTAMAVSADGRLAVTGDEKGHLAFWELPAVRLRQFHDSSFGTVRAACFSPDQRRLVTAHDWGRLVVWDTERGVELNNIDAHQERIMSLHMDQSGMRILTTAWQGGLALSSPELSQPLVQINTAFGLRGAFLAPSQDQWITLDVRGSAMWWPTGLGDFRGIEPMLKPRLREGAVPLQAYWFLRSEREIHHGDIGGIQADTSAPGPAEVNRIIHAVFDPERRNILTTSHDLEAHIWDAASGNLAVTLSRHQASIYHGSFSPDGHRVATASGDGTVKIWDARLGTELAELTDHHSEVFWVGFSPDGTFIASCGLDRSAKVWRASDQRLHASFEGHGEPVHRAVFSPDSNRLVTATEHRVFVWDLHDQRLLVTFEGHEQPITDLWFDDDGAALKVLDAARRCHTWEVSPERRSAEEVGDLIATHSRYGFERGRLFEREAIGDSSLKTWPEPSEPQLALLESLLVPADGKPVTSTTIAVKGRRYRIEAGGVYLFGLCDPNHCDRGGDCHFFRYGDAGFVSDDCFETSHAGKDIALFLDGGPIDWGTFREDHRYSVSLQGRGRPLSFHINDCAPCYLDNEGELRVSIYAE